MKKTTSIADTERLHPRSEDLDEVSLREVIFRLHQEDRVALEAVGRILPSVTEAAEAAAAALRQGGRLIYVGAGTSGRLAVLDAAECPPTFGTSPNQVVALLAGGAEAFVRAVEGAEDDAVAGEKAMWAVDPGERDLVVGITASGSTPFVLGALRAARAARARTVLLACAHPAAPAAVDVLIVPQTGAELIAGSTRLKAGTATKLVLNALSTAAMVALGKVYRGRMVDMVPTNRKLQARAVRMVQDLLECDESHAAALLEKAQGSPKLAIAMHWTGLSREDAQKALETRSLRELSKARPPKP